MINVARYRERSSKTRREEIDLNILRKFNTSSGPNSNDVIYSNFVHYNDNSLRSNNFLFSSDETTDFKLYIENEGETELNFFFKNNYETKMSTFNVSFTGSKAYIFGVSSFYKTFVYFGSIIICFCCCRKACLCIKSKIS